jgi:hypothetical protein
MYQFTNPPIYQSTNLPISTRTSGAAAYDVDEGRGNDNSADGDFLPEHRDIK